MDRLLEIRTRLNKFINREELTEEMMEEIVRADDDMIEVMIKAINSPAASSPEVANKYKDVATYNKMSLIEKLMLHFIVAAIVQGDSNMPVLNLMFVKVLVIKERLKNKK